MTGFSWKTSPPLSGTILVLDVMFMLTGVRVATTCITQPDWPSSGYDDPGANRKSLAVNEVRLYLITFGIPEWILLVRSLRKTNPSNYVYVLVSVLRITNIENILTAVSFLVK